MQVKRVSERYPFPIMQRPEKGVGMKISQCMIVKNEEKNIERALSWGNGIVSEQIVVDTGSTDRTVEIAEKMGAKVYHFVWIDDFAAAKNFAIEQASGDWIAFLDADEYLEKKNAKLLYELLTQVNRGTIKVNGVQKKCEVITCSMVHLDADGQVKMIHKQSRFFRNASHIRYKGLIHEQIENLHGNDLVNLDVNDMIKIYHTGYAWTEDGATQKGNRNIRILEKLLEKDPDSAELQLYMAESVGLTGEKTRACYYAQQVLDHEEVYADATWRMRAYQMVLIVKSQDKSVGEEQLEKLYDQACKEYPNQPDYDAIMGFHMFEHKRYEECVSYLERSLKKMESLQDFIYSRMEEFLKSIYTQLCMSYEEMNHIDKSFFYATKVLQVDRYDEGMLYPMLYKLTYTVPAPVEDIMGLLKQLYNLNSRKDTLFLLKNIRKVTNIRLEQCLKPYMAIEDQRQFF